MPEYEHISHFRGTFVKSFLVTVNQRLFHWHDDIELLTVLKGSVDININDKKYELDKGEIIIINSKEIHSITDNTNSNVLLAVQIDPRFASQYFHDMDKLRFETKPLSSNEDDTLDRIISLMGDIMLTYIKREDGFQFRQTALLNEIFYLAYRKIPKTVVEDYAIKSADKNLERLDLLLEYMQKNFDRKITLDELAARVRLDRTYLSHYIKDTLGVTFSQYLKLIRLNEAISLLTHTDKKILDITYECGFSDHRYMNKAFMEEYGCTPSEYRNNITSDIKGRRTKKVYDQFIFEDEDEILDILEEHHMKYPPVREYMM